MKVVSRLSSSFKAVITSVATLALVACGGGGGGTGGGFLPDSGGGTPTPSFTLTITGADANGAATSEFSASSPLTISVLVEDTSTNTASPVSGAVVDLTSNVGTITPANASSLTNSTGIAQFGLEFSGDDGAGTVTATYSTGGTSYTAQFNVQSIVEDVATPVVALSLAATNSTGDPVNSLSQRSPATITATFTSTLDGVVTPLAGELVSLTTNVGDISPGNGTALTDANGKAEFTLAFNGTEGAGPVTASAIFETMDYSDTLNLQAVDTGAPYQIALSLRDGTGNTSDVLSASQPITVLATVRKIDGGLLIPVGAGELVELSTTIGTLAGNGSTLTNENGVAQFELAFNGDIGAGSVTASFLSDEGAVTKTANVQSIATAVGYALSLSAAPSAGMDALTFAAGSPITLTATLSSPSASVANQPVNLVSSIGSIAPANGATLTDANGRASFEVSFNDLIGAGIATASFVTAEGSILASINLEAIAAEIDKGLLISTYAQDGTASTEFSGDSPLIVSVQLTDAQGAPRAVAGEPISLTSTVGVLDAASKLTNAAGIATFELSSSGLVGAGELRASFVTDLGTVAESRSVQSVSDDPYSVTVVASATSVSLNQDITISVTLRDPAGNAVPGEIIAIESTLGVLDRNSAVTNGAGQATFTLSYDGTIGAGVVSASYQTAGETFSNAVSYESKRPAAPTLVAQIEDQSGVATARLTSNEDLVVQITVRDRSGALVGAGETVSLASTLGTVVGNGSALTDQNGVATFTLQHDGIVGAGVITASYTLEGETVVVTRNVESVATDQNYALSIEPAVNGALFSADSALTVNVTLSSATGASVANQVIALSSDIGVVAGNGKALTNAAGLASFTLEFGGVLGAGVVTASFSTDGGVVSDSANVVAVDNANDLGLSFALSDPSGSFSLGNPLTVYVQITDIAGAPQAISGQIVQLTTQIGVLDAASKLTDVNGAATFELSSTGAIGAGLIEATLQTDLGAVREQQAVQSVSAEPYSLALSTVGGVLSLGQDLSVTVTLTSPAGQPVAGEIIGLTTTLGSLDKTSSVTDANGRASFTLNYTGQIGAGLLTATYDSGLESFSNTATIEAIAPASPTVTIATTVGGVASTQFDASSDMTVTVRVAGSSDYGVSAGDSVSLASTIGTVSGNGTALLVANAGNLEATFTVTSDGTVGAGSLTASITVNGVVFDASKGIESLGAPYALSAITFKDSTGAELANAIVSSETPYRSITASVTLTDLAGNPLNNRLIQFTSAKGELTPLDGYVLTSALGAAEVIIAYTDLITSGIGELSASYVSALGTVSVAADVQAVAPDLLLGSISGIVFSEGVVDSTPTAGNLVNQGSGVLRLDVVNSNLDINNASSSDRVKSSQTVSFSSFCLDNGLSSLFPASPVTTTSGEVSVTYTAGAGCTGADEVVATLLFGGEATTQTATKVLNISAATEAVSIEAVDVTPTTLAIEGTGNLVNVSEQATVRFRVVDGNGSPVQGETVNFSLTSNVGGLALSATTAASDAEGLVTITVSSGAVPTRTVVTAELDSTGQLAASDLITVSTAIPDQNSFTLFSDNLSVSQAYPAVNQTSNISVRLADRYNNVVPDGSVVYFTTEYGAIDARCSIVSGECSVVWRSQAPKPVGNNLSTVDCGAYDNDGDGTANNDPVGTFDPCPTSLGIEQGSRTTILATTTGEESFLDVDGDGLMSNLASEFTIDPAYDLGEAYLDENEDGAYQLNEFFVDDDSSGTRDNGDAIFTGIGCTAGTLLSGECSGTTLSVFDNIALILSASDGLYIAMVDQGTAPPSLVQSGGSVAAGSYIAYFSDQYNNQPANGATITIAATGDCSIVSPTSFTVGNNNAANAYAVGIEIASVAATAGADTVSVSIANPGSQTVTQTFTCVP